MNFHGYKLQHLDNNWRLELEAVKAQRFLRLHMARFGVSLTKLGECKKLVIWLLRSQWDPGTGQCSPNAAGTDTGQGVSKPFENLTHGSEGLLSRNAHTRCCLLFREAP